jgi:diaminopimelate epimerase
VVEVKSLQGYPVSSVGSAILNHPAFAPEKTNVTFFQRLVGNRILSTTFERGVEQETFACGTGAAAAAIVFCDMYLEALPVEVQVPGGELTVDVSPATKYLLLRGPATYVGVSEVEDFPAEFQEPRLFGAPRRAP